MRWLVIDGPEASADENMAHDAMLLEACAQPTLHFYRWKNPAATYGYFIKPEEHLRGMHLDLARRPTGGGIIFHMGDLAFSVLIPESHPAYSVNTLENYAFVNTRISAALRLFLGHEFNLLQNEEAPLDSSCRHFCMATPTKYDVMLNGRKVGGGAQRRTKKGFLHQGSIHLTLPDEEFLRSVLLPGTCVLDAMLKHSCLLLDPSLPAKESKDELKQLLIDAFTLDRVNEEEA